MTTTPRLRYRGVVALEEPVERENLNIAEAALTESATLRDQYTDTSVLDRVKVVPTLPDDLHLTTEMVATFYDVDKEAVKSLVKDNRDELSRNGLRVLRGSELKQLKEELAGQGSKVLEGPSIDPKVSQLTLFNRRTLLNVGMLLRDSEVAKQVRMYLLEVEESATAEQKDSAINATLVRLEEKVDELSENLGDYNQIETEANGLNLSATADILGMPLSGLIAQLMNDGWIHQPYPSSPKYLPTKFGLSADLVEYAPKKGPSSARVTANGRRVLRKNLNR